MPSLEYEDKGMLSFSRKCHRDDGQSLSPLPEWTFASEGTSSVASWGHALLHGMFYALNFAPDLLGPEDDRAAD